MRIFSFQTFKLATYTVIALVFGYIVFQMAAPIWQLITINRNSEADKKTPVVSRLADPFESKRDVKIVSFNNQSVSLEEDGKQTVYPLLVDVVKDTDGVLILRRNDRDSFGASRSSLADEDVGREAVLVKIWIRPKPELPEKQVWGLYL